MNEVLTAEEFATKARVAFRKLVMLPEFSCFAAKAAPNEHSYGLAAFDQLGSEETARALANLLFDFARSAKTKRNQFSSFVAVFRGPLQLTEREFETCLCLQLRQLHRLDPSDWDPHVSPEPDDSHFSFSFGGQAFDVAGLHSNSSRVAERFQWPTLVFNPHQQFGRVPNEVHVSGAWWTPFPKRAQSSLVH